MIDRFWAKVDKSGDCWLWIGKLTSNGYGQFSINRKMVRAHRVSWELHHDTIPSGMYVCHTCDNKLCVRPEHLFLGTPKDNMQDMLKKGRGRFVKVFGENNGNAKLTSSDVERIKALLATGHYLHKEIAQMVGVHRSTVSYIRARHIRASG